MPLLSTGFKRTVSETIETMDEDLVIQVASEIANLLEADERLGQAVC